MTRTPNRQLPVWAPRLRKMQIVRFYESCGQGFIDEEAIDDVGFSLYARCKSMLEVSKAIRGRPLCPNCRTTMNWDWDPDEILRCSNCAWERPWREYQKTYKRKGLFAGGMEGFIKEFVNDFQNTRSHLKRLILIDTLIHRFHWEQAGKGGGRPAVSNLIEGSMKKTVAFLDRLNYGDQIPSEMKQTREQWREKWSSNRWSQGKGQ